MIKVKFKLFPALFNAPESITYDEVNHKLLNERIDEVSIITSAPNVEEAISLAKEQFDQVLKYNFSNIPNIQYFNFRLKIIEIETIT